MQSLEAFIDYKPQRFVLPNGLSVIFLPNVNTELVAIQLWVKTGSIYENAYLGSGVSHFVEHMVFKGTENRTYANIFSEAQSQGALLNAYTSFDRTVYTYDGSAESAALGLDLLSDMLFRPTFPEEELRKERDVILREIDMCNDDPEDQLSQALFEQAFRVHPYHYPVIGIKSIFQQLTRDDLEAYWRARYPVNNMTLVVVGNLTYDWLVEKVYHYFGDWQARSLQPVFIPREPFQLAARSHRVYGDYQIVRGAVAYKIPGLGHKDGAKLQVLSNVLGCGDSAILHQKLREEKRLVHSIDASTWMADNQGLFWIQYTCEANKRGLVEDFLSENLIALAKEGLEERYVEKALNQAIVAEIDMRKTVAGQAHHLGWADVCLGDLNYSKHYLEQLRNLNADAVKNIVSKYVKDVTCTRVSLEPKLSVEKKTDEAKTDNQPLNIVTKDLPSGVRLVLQSNANFPKTHVQVLFQGGSLYEPKSLRGISQLVATLMTKDTQQRSALEIAETVENMGGQLVSFSGNNHIGLGVEVLEKDTRFAVNLLAELLSQPLFKESVFETEKASQLASIQEVLDDVFYLGFRHIRKQFFQNHPYSVGQLGDLATVSAITLEDCKRYFERICVSSNAVISVVSPLSCEQLLALLEPLFEALPQGKSFDVLTDDIAYSSEKFRTWNLDKEQSMVFKAYPMCGFASKDYFVAEYLEELFNGFSSSFVIEVREKLGLAYTVGATRLSGLNRGMLCLFAGTHAPHMKTVESEMRKAVQRVLDRKISQKEFDMCRNRLKVGQATKIQSIGKKAFYAGLCALYHLPQDRWLHYAQAIDAVALDQLMDVSQKYLQADYSSTLLISSADEHLTLS